MLNIVLNIICMHIDWWELVGVVNITVKNTLKSTSACAISEILDFKLSPCLNVVRFLLGNSLESEFYMPTFRNTLSVPSS